MSVAAAGEDALLRGISYDGQCPIRVLSDAVASSTVG